jgi:hypothetical protein
MKQGDSVLVSATGGIGGYAVQYVLNGGGTPIGVVSSPERGVRRLGVEAVIAAGPATASGRRHTQDEGEGAASARHPQPRRRQARHRLRAPGTAHHGASISCASGAAVVTCATSGYDRVRQPPLLDEARRLSSTSPTTTRPGGQQAGRPDRISRSVGCHPRGNRRGGPGVRATSTKADRHRAWRRRRVWASTTPGRAQIGEEDHAVPSLRCLTC